MERTSFTHARLYFKSSLSARAHGSFSLAIPAAIIIDAKEWISYLLLLFREKYDKTLTKSLKLIRFLHANKLIPYSDKKTQLRFLLRYPHLRGDLLFLVCHNWRGGMNSFAKSEIDRFVGLCRFRPDMYGKGTLGKSKRRTQLEKPSR